MYGNGFPTIRENVEKTQGNCGTCIVDIKDGINLCSRKSLGEDMVLAENDPTYRLSCVTAVYGDVTVMVQGAVGAAQWTR